MDDPIFSAMKILREIPRASRKGAFHVGHYADCALRYAQPLDDRLTADPGRALLGFPLRFDPTLPQERVEFRDVSGRVLGVVNLELPD